MLSDDLYTKGVPGLGEAILAQDYAAIMGQAIDEVIEEINGRQLLGCLHRGTWYVEAPPFCEAKLRAIHARRQTEDNAKRESDRQRREQERREEERRRNRDREERSQSSDGDLDRRHAETLGLRGRVTREDVKRRWRELSKQYHPDNVQHLGPKLREVAEREMKDINAAYHHFRTKYGL